MKPGDKARLEEKARRAGTSVGELVRRSVDAYEPEVGTMEIEALLQLLEESQQRAFEALYEAERELTVTREYFEAKGARATVTGKRSRNEHRGPDL